MIKLEKVTNENYEAVSQLSVHEHQVEELDWDITAELQDYLNNEKNEEIIFAIYHNATPIGLVEIGSYENGQDNYNHQKYGDKVTYEIQRMMIDGAYQGKGFGKQALPAIIDYIKTFPHGLADAITVTYFLSNMVAKSLYQSVGFVETGEKWDGDTLDPWDDNRTDELEMAEVGARLALSERRDLT